MNDFYYNILKFYYINLIRNKTFDSGYMETDDYISDDKLYLDANEVLGSNLEDKEYFLLNLVAKSITKDDIINILNNLIDSYGSGSFIKEDFIELISNNEEYLKFIDLFNQKYPPYNYSNE